jgi:hydroxymethylpyrimidine kinase/phosphomethylpyrimidine kinase
VAEQIKQRGIPNVVVDPVMIASSGDPLVAEDAVMAFKTELFPLATLITPNLPEAGFLLQRKLESAAQMEEAAKDLLAMGPKAVLLKGGHLAGSEEIIDFFATSEGVVQLPQITIKTTNTHGTGCTLASTIAANLARQEAAAVRSVQIDVLAAVKAAQTYLHSVLEISASLKIGQGDNRPLNHQRAAGWCGDDDHDGAEATTPAAAAAAAGDANMAMPLTQAMWDGAQKEIDASESHTFLTRMVDGTLPMDQFRYYVIQDMLYLVDFADCLMRLAAAAKDQAKYADAAMLRAEAEKCIKAEQGLHSSHLAKWCMDESVLEASPTTVMYCSWLLKNVTTLSYAEGLATLLPCFWVYMHVGQVMLKLRDGLPADINAGRPQEFDKWIDMYAGDGYGETVSKYRKLVEVAAAAADNKTRAAMGAHFKKGCELEWMFWTAAEETQGWPSF